MDTILAHGAAILLLLALPPACALLLRRAGAPGSPVLGGVLVGVLLSPTIFGRTLPSAYESIFLGGTEERKALDALISRQGADLVAAQAARLSASALEELRRQHETERALLEEALWQARWQHQKPLRIFTAIIITLASAGLHAVPKPRDHAQESAGLAGPVSIGVWSAAVPGAIAYVASVRWWGFSIPESALISAAVMIGPWAMSQFDRAAADQAERDGAHLIQTAGRFATIIALAIAGYALFVAESWAGLLWLLPLAAIVVGWLLRPGEQMHHGGPRRATELEEVVDERHAVDAGSASERTTAVSPLQSPPWSSVALCGELIAVLAALAALRIDLFEHFAFWPIVIVIILSGDGRWLGALIGTLLLGGRRALLAMRLVLGTMSVGPTQLAITALAVHLWLIPEPAALALLLGALTIELTAPLRRSMADRLTEIEEEIIE